MSASGRLLPTVVDTNLFVSGTIVKRGAPFALLEAWRARAFDLLLFDQQRIELLDVLHRPWLVQKHKVRPEELADIFDGLAKATPVTPSPALPLAVRDPEDEKILAAAVGGDADYLVTGDADLLVLRDDPRLGKHKIVTAAEFLAVLDAEARPSRPGR